MGVVPMAGTWRRGGAIAPAAGRVRLRLWLLPMMAALLVNGAARCFLAGSGRVTLRRRRLCCWPFFFFFNRAPLPSFG